MDLGNSSQETVSSVDMKIQCRGETRCEPAEGGPSVEVDFIFGLNDDSSRSSEGTTVVPDKKIKTVISADEEPPGDLYLEHSNSDSELPDI